MAGLTDRALKAIRPTGKMFKVADEGGLHVRVTPKGRVAWQWSYRRAGTQQTLGLGSYPAVTLREARQARDGLRAELDAGRDPRGHLLAMRAATEPEEMVTAREGVAPGQTWREVVEEYLMKRQREGAASMTIKRNTIYAEKTYPALGDRNIADIEAIEVLTVLRHEETAGHFETAARLRSFCSQVFRYGVAIQRVKRDPTADLRGALTVKQETHHPALTKPNEVGQLMRAVNSYRGQRVMGAMLQIHAMTAVRPGEIRLARWEEVDLDAAIWNIPVERMKGKRGPHVVPLSRQAADAFLALRPYCAGSDFCFPGNTSDRRPYSNMAENAALRACGFGSGVHVGHGFRSTFSTICNEAGMRSDVIEAQLAHIGNDKVRGAYNRALYMSERVALMQWYADELDRLAGII